MSEEKAAMDVEQEEAEWEDVEDNGKLKKKIIKEGTGWERPRKGAEVHVHYTGRLHDTGDVFDSSVDHGEEFSFKLGKGQVIKGWDEGVKTMKKGEKALFVIDSEYGYGEHGHGDKIPKNATLEFEIELLSWISEEPVTDDKKVLMRTIEDGEGWDRPKDESTCIVHYKGRVKGTDEVFEDTRIDHPDGMTVIVGNEHVIPGIEKALEKLKKGAKVELFVDPAYGYGEAGAPEKNVPPGAHLVYELELVSFEKAKESYAMQGDERVATCEQCKLRGNTAFKDGRLTLALTEYKRATKYIDNGTYSEEEKERKHALEAQVRANMAAVYLKLKNYSLAQQEATKTLEIEHRNVKALYRRAVALGHQQYYEDALRDLSQVLELDPHNAEAKRLREAITKRKAAQDNKDRSMFARMLKAC
eukprot:TRINITY_DN154_c0_g1_i1.p1 TRINITY_DN154_c0_g1~~TRINITY_DN154_c0_g1_i1.p1  ORF type:complete len:416 (+),score=149.24 TRINITY_DN154_c0_g1_i1:70-1317(+)